MKIALITRHAISNYGSILQVIATQNKLQYLGHEVKVIDYVRKDENYKCITKNLLKKNKKWNGNILTRTIYMLMQSPSYIIMGRKFEKMQKHELNLTKRYTSLVELENDCPNADIYMSGSDQIWGAIGQEEYDSAYFLEFAGNVKKIAYAGSFGKIQFTDNIKRNYKILLNDYWSIGVREHSAKAMVEEMIGKEITQVLDPTLLLTAEQWSQYIKKEINKKYVLIYQLHSNKQMDQYAKEFARRKQLPLIRITPSLHHVSRGGKIKFLPTLGEFISYIKNANYMITDSFHGIAFALNFGIQFISISPGETETRNISVLELTKLEDRILKSYDDFNIFDKKINYEIVNKILVNERKKSIAWLENALER